MKARWGYCGMTADFIHIGHINFLNQCKEHCESLCVGLMTDEIVEQYKGKNPMMSYDQRKILVKSLVQVYKVWAQETFEFPHHIFRFKEFYGDQFLIFDSEEHKRKGADVIIPRTKEISSTAFKNTYLS